MTLQELQKQALELSVGDRWALLKLLIDSLQSLSQVNPIVATSNVQDAHFLAQYYGCIDDETFICHPQPDQSARESLL
jgi:hypothetical protein